MKLAQDYKNIASLYCQNTSSQQNSAKITEYLRIFCENNPNLILKKVYGNQYLYEWKSPSLFMNGFSPCLIIEVRTCKNLGRMINLKNPNILEKIAYSNFVLTEDNILNKMSQVQLLGSF
jgi:hypothetical protein